ncbi:hypothetical protein [Devosia sp. MC1541]|uniref:hypothetical protein n=1 Tax=Devosia sp. MC1541 TaxID=2725264 RepID=UPI00145F547E|nr:hypothetical protein [Devosia sp. MC1541]
MIAWELNLQLIAVRIIAALIAFPIQGFAVAYLAVKLGDKGPRYDGRTTLNPAVHTDLPGLLALVLTGFGWSKPVVVNGHELKSGKLALLLLTLCGSLTMVALAWLAMQLITPVLLSLPHTAGITIAAFLRTAARIYLAMAVLALLPLPSLAGRFLLQIFGAQLSDRMTLISSWVLFAITALGVTRFLLSPTWNAVVSFVVGT